MIVGLLLIVLQRTGNNPLNLLQPGEKTATAPVFHRDFPGSPLATGLGHDAQGMYMVARQPMHLRALAPTMSNNARYRLQRILFPVLAWSLHPSGGGLGLVRAMILVDLVAVFLGCLAFGSIAAMHGRPAASAVVFALVPGVYATARITTADNLAMALVLGAIACSLRGRPVLAVVVAVAAVLTREVSLVPLAGFAFWRRGREGIALALVPATTAAGWWLYLRLLLPQYQDQPPRAGFLVGIRHSWAYWTSSNGRGSLAVVGLALALAVFALARSRLTGPFAGAIILELVLVCFLAAETMQLFYNSARTFMPLTMYALAALLATPHRQAGIAAQNGETPLDALRLP